MRQNAERQMKYRARILCIDPEPRIPEWFPAALRQAGYLVERMQSSEVVLDPARLKEFDLIILDISLPEQDGLKLLHDLAGQKGSPPVIVITDRETALLEEELIKAGAYDCLLKPLSHVVLEHVLERTLSQGIMRRELQYLRSQWTRPDLGKPLGISAGWSQVLGLIEQAAAADKPVLLVGESGVGKGDAARLLHSLGARANGPFVRVNCTRLAMNLLASEDFALGGEAFAGMESNDDQFFHIANGGTLFMEEIGLLPAASQAKVLHLLVEGTAETATADPAHPADVRTVASSSIDLGQEAAEGRFLRDLLNLFGGMIIRVPPLRERVEDIPMLAAAFLERCATRLRKNVSSLHPEAMALLESYHWPGNVRELRNVIDRAVLLADTPEIVPSLLPLYSQEGMSPGTHRPLNLRAVLAAEEKKTLIEALRRAHGVRREAARLLGIDPRNLVYFLRKYGLDKREGQE